MKKTVIMLSNENVIVASSIVAAGNSTSWYGRSENPLSQSTDCLSKLNPVPMDSPPNRIDNDSEIHINNNNAFFHISVLHFRFIVLILPSMMYLIEYFNLFLANRISFIRYILQKIIATFADNATIIKAVSTELSASFV